MLSVLNSRMPAFLMTFSDAECVLGAYATIRGTAESLFRPGQERPQAFLSQPAPPEFLEKDISDLDVTAFDQAKSCAADKPSGGEFDDSELGAPARLDRQFASRNSSADLFRGRDAVGEVGADIRIHIQTLEVGNVSIFE